MRACIPVRWRIGLEGFNNRLVNQGQHIGPDRWPQRAPYRREERDHIKCIWDYIIFVHLWHRRTYRTSVVCLMYNERLVQIQHLGNIRTCSVHCTSPWLVTNSILNLIQIGLNSTTLQNSAAFLDYVCVILGLYLPLTKFGSSSWFGYMILLALGIIEAAACTGLSLLLDLIVSLTVKWVTVFGHVATSKAVWWHLHCRHYIVRLVHHLCNCLIASGNNNYLTYRDAPLVILTFLLYTVAMSRGARWGTCIGCNTCAPASQLRWTWVLDQWP